MPQKQVVVKKINSDGSGAGIDPRHNYVRKIKTLIERGIITNGSNVLVQHDDWCSIFLGTGLCNCNCFILVDGKRINV